MSTTTVTAALTAALNADDVPILNGVYPLPNGRGSSMTNDQCDLVDWGVLYGLAFAMLREGDPWADTRDLAAHARDAVRDALTAAEQAPEMIDEVTA